MKISRESVHTIRDLLAVLSYAHTCNTCFSLDAHDELLFSIMAAWRIIIFRKEKSGYNKIAHTYTHIHSRPSVHRLYLKKYP